MTACVCKSLREESKKLDSVQNNLRKRGDVDGLFVVTEKLRKVTRINVERCGELRGIKYPKVCGYCDVKEEEEVRAVLNTYQQLGDNLDSCKAMNDMTLVVTTAKKEMQSDVDKMQDEIAKLEKANRCREVRSWLDEARRLVAEDIVGKGAIWKDVVHKISDGSIDWPTANARAGTLFGITLDDWQLVSHKVYKELSNVVRTTVVEGDTVKAMAAALRFNDLWVGVETRSGAQKSQVTKLSENEIEGAKISLVKILEKLNKSVVK
jgi:hypothetical protein